ncbi:virB8 family protein [Ensifer sp. SL37]|uniref:virB8 family protein n=1 Tax=Ensifer sp. SL37 TaxID=2995137 RepID=UPI002273D40A|nr:type IV secretion system protein [Ensifer sp. SL37]MCY1741006.1 type IV secretion system protein [Ensifer sp. SL37]
MATVKEVLEEELIFGARDREARWRKIAFVSMGFGAAGSILAGVTALVVDKPAPALIPFDPSTGSALPMANVGTISMAEKEAVMQSLVYAYVRDRESYNQLDNDLRIESVFARSTGQAQRSLQGLWDASNPEYPPTVYGANARIDVAVSSIANIGNNRAQARITKRLTTSEGMTEGTFIVTLAYAYDPSTLRNLDGVWANPFGFTVGEYTVAAERYREAAEGPQEGKAEGGKQ